MLRGILAGTLIVPALLFVAASWFDYHAAFANARRDLTHTSEVAREQAAKIFESQSQVGDRINDLVRTLTPAMVVQSQRSLHEAFAVIVARLAQVQGVLLTDMAGHPLVNSSSYPVADRNVQDYDYFRAVTGGFSGTYVSRTQVGAVNGLQFFGLAQPWTAPDGTLKGVIDVAVSPAFFSDFYQVLVNEGGEGAGGKVVALIRDDGEFLARFPPLPKPHPALRRSEMFFAAIRRNPDSGIYTARSVVDDGQPERLFAYHKVQGYPVYVAAGRRIDKILAAWYRTVASHLVFGLPATLTLFLVTWTALVQARRQEEALSYAQAEMGRRERAEAALLRAQRLEAVGQMTGGVAHDFNNLLTVILGSAETLARRADDPARVRRLAGQITLAAKHGGKVTQQLLTFSRRQFVHPETVDINQLLRDFRQVLDRAASKAVQIEFTLQHRLGPVRLDPGHFEAAVLNLVGNGRDAMPNGGRISVATSEVTLADHPDLAGGAYIRVAVSDTGVGMDPQTAAKAFEPFFTTKEIGKGTGLGLSQVYGFAKQAGGDVRIVSTPGVGTTVELLLPRGVGELPQPAADAEAPGEAAAPRAQDGEVVLVVEDNPEVMRTVVDALENLGYRAITAASAQAALERLRLRERLDIMFIDMVLPGGVSGLQLVAQARQLQRGIRILLTSGYTVALDRDLAGDIPVLLKPYDQARLARELRAALDAQIG